MAAGDTFYLQLHKLSGVNSEDALEHIVLTLWKSRKTGLKPHEKTHIQSLLNLPGTSEVDLVLASLRSLMRKCVHENFTSDNLLKLLPPDLPLDLQGTLIALLQKYQDLWKADVSRNQHTLPKTIIPYQAKTSPPPSLPSSDSLPSLWPRCEDPTSFSRDDPGTSTPLDVDSNLSDLDPLSFRRDAFPLDNLGILPHLKSMSWTMENQKTGQARKVPVINLTLHDYSKSPSGEMEVKFQLTRDTLDAMLRSMTYISEQLTCVVAPTEPVQKKQKQ